MKFIQTTPKPIMILKMTPAKWLALPHRLKMTSPKIKVTVNVTMSKPVPKTKFYTFRGLIT